MLTEGVAAMTTYTVHAKRWAHGWELHIDGEGVTQARSLAAADRQVRDYLSLMHDLDDDAAFDVVIVPVLGGTIERDVRKAREAVADLASRQRKTAEMSRAAVQKLRKAGLKGAEIAAVLGVTPQRVSQLTETSTKAARASTARTAARQTAGSQKRTSAAEPSRVAAKSARSIAAKGAAKKSAPKARH
jgi:predicted XRE-type DNA-binding protein